MLSKGVSSTTFWVSGMTQPEIEPQSPRPFVNTWLYFLVNTWIAIFNHYWLFLIGGLNTQKCKLYNTPLEMKYLYIWFRKWTFYFHKSFKCIHLLTPQFTSFQPRSNSPFCYFSGLNFSLANIKHYVTQQCSNNRKYN